jgi:hypothetical protein
VPFVTTRVLPPGWSEHHRPAAYGFLTGTCDARGPDRAGGPTGIVYGDPIWEDKPCSVQVLSQSARPTVTVDSTEVQVTHRVSVPIDLTASYGDIITITANPDDPRLTGTVLTVVLAESGTTNWTRELACVEGNRREAAAA